MVEKQTDTSKWFAGGSPYCRQSGFTLLSGHWTDEFQDLVLFDKYGNRRQTHKDMVRGFQDDTRCGIWTEALKRQYLKGHIR